MKKILASILFCLASLAMAQPLTLVTLTGFGSLSDTALRQAAPAIERHTGRQVVVVNMPGGEGLVGLRHFQGLPDGSALLAGNSALALLAAQGRLPMTLTPLAGLTQTDMAVYSPLGSMGELLALREPLAGSTSPMTELSIRLFDQERGTRSRPVGYKQFGQAVMDLSAGRLDYLIAPVGSGAIEAAVATGKVRRLQVLGPLFTWSAFFAKHPDETLAQQLRKAVAETEFKGVQAFSVDARGVLRAQDADAALIARAGVAP